MYPFSELEVGDSFTVPVGVRKRVGAAAERWKKRHPGWDYRCRSAAKTTRLWRVA